ncbi:MAG TPA: 2Fe-2S iron-sulfur cluster-binding protein [Steroidobacteraceae bacterium]|nr:2Fe-2S iron-sulfur cluster-binding protein [Steroidobacteraceae bacterium]
MTDSREFPHTAAAAMCTMTFDGRRLTGAADRPLIDFLAAHGVDLPHVCYHRALRPLDPISDFSGKSGRAS